MSVVHCDTYRVFLTPQGDGSGLYVSGTSNVAFDNRVVAKRREIEGARLEPVEEPSLPALPKLPGVRWVIRPSLPAPFFAARYRLVPN